MVLTIETIREKKWNSLNTPSGKEIFKRYFLKEYPQFLIVDEILEGRNKKIVRNLVSKYTRAWESLGYIKGEKKKIPKKKNKMQNEEVKYYKADLNFLFDYLKEEYNLTLNDIEKATRYGMDEAEYFNEWLFHSVKELFENFFYNPKIKEYILENYFNDSSFSELSFPEFLWSLITSINTKSWLGEDIKEGVDIYFSEILKINKKLSLRIIKFKRIGEWFFSQEKWYDNLSQVPKKWIEEFKKEGVEWDGMLNCANEMFREYYKVFYNLFNNPKIRSLNIQKNTDNPNEKELLRLLKK